MIEMIRGGRAAFGVMTLSRLTLLGLIVKQPINVSVQLLALVSEMVIGCGFGGSTRSLIPGVAVRLVSGQVAHVHACSYREGRELDCSEHPCASWRSHLRH